MFSPKKQLEMNFFKFMRCSSGAQTGYNPETDPYDPRKVMIGCEESPVSRQQFSEGSQFFRDRRLLLLCDPLNLVVLFVVHYLLGCFLYFWFN